ncbi:MAG: hypothetical protein LUD68_03415 [Rikenellaceae bacterium]|nr:hypothetical protein [Rikenellaceae bacterium]
MKRVPCAPGAPMPTPDDATQKAIDLLDAAHDAVGQIVEIRQREKLSVTRATHIAREIKEMKKVLSFYLPTEN